MKSSEFVKKLCSGYLWINIIAMIVVVVMMCFGAAYGLSVYTHHGESIAIPNVKHKSYGDAKHILEGLGMTVVVQDTGYVKSLPADCILELSPAVGERVKEGHIIYLTVNAPNSPTITLPDVIDNSSAREAKAKLIAMGFKVGQPQYVSGEKDWVYGILVRGKSVVKGDKISVEDPLIIQIGNGIRDAEDVVDYVEPVYTEENDYEEPDANDVDEFEEVTAPEEPQKSNATKAESTKNNLPN